MQSLKNRNLIEEAQAAGSHSKTLTGAVRYLVKQLRKSRDFRSKHPYARITPPWQVGHKSNWWAENDVLIWTRKLKERKSYPSAKRARDDKRFRKNYMAKLRKRERDNVALKYANENIAYNELRHIQRQYEIMGVTRPLPKRGWMADVEAFRLLKELALEAGLMEGEDRFGDVFKISMFEAIHNPNYLRRFKACGKVLGVVCQSRTRTYANSSQFRQSERNDYFLVGVNENGNAFAHQVPHGKADVAAAYRWIWSGKDIEMRQGDIGLYPSNLKTIEGENGDHPIGGGHSSHRFVGEIHHSRNQIFVRNGFLIHTKGQHPTIYLDSSCWYRLIEARRSQIGMSSAD